jgi:hypothetical protein
MAQARDKSRPRWSIQWNEQGLCRAWYFCKSGSFDTLVPANEKVPVEQCNYLVSLNLPSQPHTDIEQDYIHDPSFEKEYCTTFLDGASSKWWARLVWIPWLPQGLLDRGRVYGEYCLLKRK